MAKADKNQYTIVRINHYTGNPHQRTSLLFNVTFESETLDLPYSRDLANSQQMEEYILSQPTLYPLQFTAVESKHRIGGLKKIAIVEVKPGDEAFLHLRYFDGVTQTWYDTRGFKDLSKHYVVPISFQRWVGKGHLKILAVCKLFGLSCFINAYDIQALVVLPNKHDLSVMYVLAEHDRKTYGSTWVNQ